MVFGTVLFLQSETGWRVSRTSRKLQRQWKWLQLQSYEQFKLELKIPVAYGSHLPYCLAILLVCVSIKLYSFELALFIFLSSVLWLSVLCFIVKMLLGCQHVNGQSYQSCSSSLHASKVHYTGVHIFNCVISF